MSCADFIHLGELDTLGGVVVHETEFFLHATALVISVVVTAPDARHSEILKSVAQKLARGFGYQALSPERFANPIANSTKLLKKQENNEKRGRNRKRDML